ncbi:hypothetical protein [Nocardioides sp. 616]|uniref:hypothetical protein n=1 Tax=Nocardioides sp. 616 TaxID=2268090 RepID=UPI000CE442E3|nr:hypothetical protein [Nocardioides sp. 616]
MARGGYGSGSGVPLSDRVRSDPAASSPTTPPERSGGDGEDAAGRPGRHCWVTVPVDGPRARPGLLLEWRQGARGRWEGRVVYSAQLRPGRWALVEEWIPAELLASAP